MQLPSLPACGLLNALFLSVLMAQSALPGSDNPGPVYRWTTLAGRASIGNEDGPAAEARFNQPGALFFDSEGNLFVADTGNHVIRKITPAGVVSTLAGKAGEPGSADGLGAGARFRNPQGVAVDRNGNVYVADTGNHTIRLVTPTGMVTTLAGQPGTAGYADGPAGASLFNGPTSLTVDGNGQVYLLSGGLRRISGGSVQTIPLSTFTRLYGGQASISEPLAGLAVDASGLLYVYDHTGSLLRMEASGQWVELVSPGSYFGSPLTVFNDVAGNVYWIRNLRYARDGQRHEGNGLRADGSVDHLGAIFEDEYGYGVQPVGVAVDHNGVWYNTRTTDHAIMRGRNVYAGTPRSAQPVDGPPGTARFESIYDLVPDPSGNVWVQESNFHLFSTAISQGYSYSHSLRRLSTATGSIATLLAPEFLLARFEIPRGLGLSASGIPYVAFYRSGGTPTGTIVAPTTGEVVGPDFSVQEFTIDSLGNMWAYDGYKSVFRRSVAGTWTAVAGGGSYLDAPKDGQGAEARLGNIRLLATDVEGNCYALSRYDYVTDRTCFIRKITPGGTVTTVGKDLVHRSGPTDAIVWEYPEGFAVKDPGKFIVTYKHEVVEIDAQGTESVLGGKTGEPGSSDGTGSQARLDHPGSVAVDRSGNIFVADGADTTVRRGEYLGYSPAISMQPQSLTVAAGNSAQFSVTASGTPAPSYQWYFDGKPYPGATASTLSFPRVRTSDAGEYFVIVTNAAGNVTSAKAMLTVTGSSPAPSPSRGGGGSPSIWFCGILALLGARRWFQRRQTGT